MCSPPGCRERRFTIAVLIGGIGPEVAALSVLLIPRRSRAAVGEPAASTA
jgi:hypothetical protein